MVHVQPKYKVFCYLILLTSSRSKERLAAHVTKNDPRDIFYVIKYISLVVLNSCTVVDGTQKNCSDTATTAFTKQMSRY